MNPRLETPGSPTEDSPQPQAEPVDQRRRIRWFVAGHVALVATVYGLALAAGGGHADAMPPDDASLHALARAVPIDATVGRPAAPAAKAPSAATGAPPPSSAHPRAIEPAGQAPAWTTRAELAAPWAQH